LGGESPTAAPGGIANTGVAVLTSLTNHNGNSVAPPPPATWGHTPKNQKKVQESLE